MRRGSAGGGAPSCSDSDRSGGGGGGDGAAHAAARSRIALWEAHEGLWATCVAQQPFLSSRVFMTTDVPVYPTASLSSARNNIVDVYIAGVAGRFSAARLLWVWPMIQHTTRWVYRAIVACRSLVGAEQRDVAFDDGAELERLITALSVAEPDGRWRDSMRRSTRGGVASCGVACEAGVAASAAACAAASAARAANPCAVRGAQLFTSKGYGEGRARMHVDGARIEAGLERHEIASRRSARRGDARSPCYAFSRSSEVRFADSAADADAGALSASGPLTTRCVAKFCCLPFLLFSHNIFFGLSLCFTSFVAVIAPRRSASGPLTLRIERWEADDMPNIWSFRNATVTIARFPRAACDAERDTGYYDAVPTRAYASVATLVAVGRLGVQMTSDAQLDVVTGDLHTELWNRAHAYTGRHNSAVAFAAAALAARKGGVLPGAAAPAPLRGELQPGQFDAPQVSVLLCTVTFYANLAHNLTRSP